MYLFFTLASCITRAIPNETFKALSRKEVPKVKIHPTKLLDIFEFGASATTYPSSHFWYPKVPKGTAVRNA